MQLICFTLFDSALGGKRVDDNEKEKVVDQLENLTDIREHDVPYHVRVSIDKKINVGSWYDVTFTGSEEPPTITRREDLLERPVSGTIFERVISTAKFI